MKRAYSLLQIKAVSEDQRIIEGIASTPEVDRMGDIVEPEGMEAKMPVPLLWQHDSGAPIGQVISAVKSADGITIRAKLARIDEPGQLKDMLDMAWQAIKSGLVRGLSIGFRSLESAFIDGTYGMRFSKWELLELSAVTIPANQDATITSVKSIDQELRAASGRERRQVVRLDGPSPGVAGVKAKSTHNNGVKTMNIREQIKQFEATRAAKMARMTELMEGATKEGATLDKEQSEEYDTLDGEVKSVDAHLQRLDVLEKANIARATALPAPTAADPQKTADAARGNFAIHINKDVDEKFKGQNFTRMVIARALASHVHVPASVIAEKRWGKTNPMLVNILKANEVAGGGSGSGEWGAELVQADTRYTGDFITFLYSKTIFDQLPLREVPANVAIKGQDGAATGYWVGESKAIPDSKADFSTISLTPLKVAAICVVSNELLRDSSPSAEQLVRDSLVQSTAQRIDSTFISTAAASAGVSPAGILNGLVAIHSVGNDAASVREDIKALYAPFISAKNAADLAFIMPRGTAKALSLMFNSLGIQEFPGITSEGGTLLGDPVYTGDNITATDIILCKPSDIWEIGDQGIQVSISRDAAIEQNSVPAGASDTPSASANTLVSMFQTESTAIKVVRPINFQKRRTSAVAYIDDQRYGSKET